MKIEKMIQENSAVVGISGRLDTVTAPELEKELSDIVNGEVTDLVFDFSGLEYTSSAGLRVLLSAQKAMSKKGSMKIKNVCSEIMEIFEITGFLDILTIE